MDLLKFKDKYCKKLLCPNIMGKYSSLLRFVLILYMKSNVKIIMFIIISCLQISPTVR